VHRIMRPLLSTAQVCCLGLADRKWGQAYLTRSFFHMLGETMPQHVMLAAAQDGDQLVAGVVYALRSLLNQKLVPHRSAESLLRNVSKTAGRNQLASKAHDGLLAGALNLVGSHAIYGRNWGCAYGTQISGLHFECCYYMESSLFPCSPPVQGHAVLCRTSPWSVTSVKWQSLMSPLSPIATL